jgi:ER-bound oxygenase mpaB/B'/Rubber oxygenase, catalytic domain
MHNRYAIANEDMLYVLSTFVFEPVRWIGRYGWRPLSQHEKLAAFHFYREVGRRMGVRDIPADYAAFEAFNVAYERVNFRWTPSNVEVGEATLGLFVSWHPRWLRPLVRRTAIALLDEPLRAAFGFARQPVALRWSVRALLSFSGRLKRLRRPVSEPTFRGHIRSYPDGYDLAALGAGPPPADLDPALLANRAR